MNIASKVYLGYRNAHANRVVRNSDEFMSWYDKAAAMIFAGKSKSEVLDAISPWGCDPTQSNGVQAGMGQAIRLIKTEDMPK